MNSQKIVSTLFFILLLTTYNISALHTINQNNFSKTANSISLPSIPELIDKINETQLQSYIRNIQSFGPHPTGSSALDNLQTYLYSTLSNMSLLVLNHSWNYKGLTGENIIATIPGSTAPKNTMILCAHYDSVAVSPGADDDGSGIATILMIASILSHYSFNSTINFILFSGEEQGLYGSMAYAKKAKQDQQHIIGVLALDKIGYAKTTEDGSIIRHHADPASSWMITITKDILTRYHQSINLSVLPLPFDASSDHRAFVERGYAGSNFVEHVLNPYYHTSEDTLEHMNLTYLSKVGKLALATTITLASTSNLQTSEDLDIRIQGKHNNDFQAQLSIICTNNLYPQETLNVSITIDLVHILNRKAVEIKKEFYTIPCSWQLTKEINESYRFHLGPQTYSTGFFILTVSVHGIKDDLSLSVRKQTYGIIFPAYNLLIIPIH